MRDPRTRCEQLYPSASFPREVAGEDVGADIVKCRLKRIDPVDYRGQQPPRGTWLSFGPP